MSGQLFVISAPSGTGKSTIGRALRETIGHLGYSVSHTTRKPRDTEVDGVDYHFVDKRTFEEMIEKGVFVEWAQVYDNYYGTSFSNLEKQTASGHDVILDLDSQGARSIKKHFRDSVLIFVLPPSMKALEKRLKERATDAARVIKKRLNEAAREIVNCLWYDYILVNDNLDKAIKESRAIIIAERCKTARKAEMVKALFHIPVS